MDILLSFIKESILSSPIEPIPEFIRDIFYELISRTFTLFFFAKTVASEMPT